MPSFAKSPLFQARSLPLSVYAVCLGIIDLWEVCASGALGSAPFFKMGFNRDDCLTMGSSVKYLWVANYFSLIRT